MISAVCNSGFLAPSDSFRTHVEQPVAIYNLVPVIPNCFGYCAIKMLFLCLHLFFYKVVMIHSPSITSF